jgi:hypothetical protein
MKNCLIICLLFLTAFLQAQDNNSNLLKGKIASDFEDLENINVTNSNQNTHTLTDKKGYFEIAAKAGDTLQFSAVQFKNNRLVVNKEHFDKGLIVVRMEVLLNYLDEVQIKENEEINALSLGIVSGAPKKYSPAERKLKTAGDFKPIHLLAILGGTLPVDPILNAINGRTKRLKKEIKIEKKEVALNKLNNLDEFNSYFTQLQIPEENIEGFKYYIVEDERLIAALNAKNIPLSKFIISELAVKFNKLQEDEKQSKNE